MKDVLLPAVGVTLAEGILLSWLRQPGDPVTAGDVVAEVETDKSTIEIESPADGVLGAHRVAAGDTVMPGSAITEIIEAGDDVAEDGPATPAPQAAPDGPADVTDRAPEGAAERIPHRLSPRERLAARSATRATPVQAGSIWEAGSFRSLIADKVSESWRTIPHFAVTRQIDATSLRRAHASNAAAKVTLTDLMLRALAASLRATAYPGPGDIGLAVATDSGVMIPVIRGVDEMDLPMLAHERTLAVERARSGRLAPADLASPPAITLSNLGPMGVDQFSGVIALDQHLLLTVGRIAERPVVIDGVLTVQANFFATLNVDHRVFDGDHAARLLEAFADQAGDPGLPGAGS